MTSPNVKACMRLTGLQNLYCLMTALIVTLIMRVIASTAASLTELKPRQTHVPSSAPLYAKGVAELGKGKAACLLAPLGLLACQKKLRLVV